MKKTSIVVSALLCGIALNTLVQPNLMIPQTAVAAEQPTSKPVEHPTVPPVGSSSEKPNGDPTANEETPSMDHPITITINFLDQEKNVIDKKTIDATSSDYNFPHEWSKIYGEYGPHQTTMFTKISSQKNHFEVNVISKSHDDTIKFIDQATKQQIDTSKNMTVESGKIYHTVDMESLLPKGYEFVSTENKFQATVEKKEHIFEVKKIQQEPKIVHKIFQIISDDGDVVKTIHRDLATGSQFTLTQAMVGDDYEIKSPITYTVVDDHDEGTMVPMIIHKKKISNKIQLFDDANSKEPLKELTLTGSLGSKINLSNDDLKGLRLSKDNTDHRFVKDENPIKILVQIENEIQYVDQQGKTIGQQLIAGKGGEKVDLQAPKGFELLTDKQHTITYNVPAQKVAVKRIHNGSTGASGSNAGSSSSVESSSDSHSVDVPTTPKVESYRTIVSTHPSNGKVALYDLNGKKGNRLLSENSDWQVDRKTVINGETYFRVSTDEWVKAGDVFELKYQAQIVRTKASGLANLINSKGQSASNRSLAPHSLWFSDKVAVINGQQHFRISTDEWISASDIEI